jgi:hypothetical protein
MRAGMLLPAVVVAAALVGCGNHTGYEKAFSAQSALAGNSHEFDANADQTFRTVKVTLVQQGFTIEQVDVAAGLIKAIRSLQDPKRSAYAYLITASVDITGQPSGRSTTVTVAASQQTVLHKDSEKYFHLLGLVPIPSGRVHQTVVTKEGNIDTAAFYNDFFESIHKNLQTAAIAAAAVPAEATVAPQPASGADTARTYPVGNNAAAVAPAVAELAAAAPAATDNSATATPIAAPAPSTVDNALVHTAPLNVAPMPKTARDPNVLAPLDP